MNKEEKLEKKKMSTVKKVILSALLVLILAIVSSIVGISVVNKFIALYGKPNIGPTALFTLGILVIVYLFQNNGNTHQVRTGVAQFLLFFRLLLQQGSGHRAVVHLREADPISMSWRILLRSMACFSRCWFVP